MADFGIGQPLPRKEDARLLTGGGRYLPDIALPDMAFAAMVRSPHAHARIAAIDTARARAMPGVLAVLTRAEFDSDGLRPIPHQATTAGGTDIALRVRPGFQVFTVDIATSRRWEDPLRRRTGRHGGRRDRIAAAKDAAEHVAVDYEPLAGRGARR